ncbi:uncharacterized protein LOC142109290 isoform X4 [Mixophyes fleayi]|uniref:uncharacterized protein LOC142109290 isoform X4 n=1 Tax=Mixophyes fleayi TaxID=3061075 RepID=UPI003F4E3530
MMCLYTIVLGILIIHCGNGMRIPTTGGINLESLPVTNIEQGDDHTKTYVGSAEDTENTVRHQDDGKSIYFDSPPVTTNNQDDDHTEIYMKSPMETENTVQHQDHGTGIDMESPVVTIEPGGDHTENYMESTMKTENTVQHQDHGTRIDMESPVVTIEPGGDHTEIYMESPKWTDNDIKHHDDRTSFDLESTPVDNNEQDDDHKIVSAFNSARRMGHVRAVGTTEIPQSARAFYNILVLNWIVLFNTCIIVVVIIMGIVIYTYKKKQNKDKGNEDVEQASPANRPVCQILNQTE